MANSALGTTGPSSRPLDINCVALDSATSLDACVDFMGLAKRSPLDTKADILMEDDNTSQSRGFGRRPTTTRTVRVQCDNNSRVGHDHTPCDFYHHSR